MGDYITRGVGKSIPTPRECIALASSNGLALAEGTEGNIIYKLPILSDNDTIRQTEAGVPLLQVVIHWSILLILCHFHISLSIDGVGRQGTAPCSLD